MGHAAKAGQRAEFSFVMAISPEKSIIALAYGADDIRNVTVARGMPGRSSGSPRRLPVEREIELAVEPFANGKNSDREHGHDTGDEPVIDLSRVPQRGR
jgi:hypothetical protein